MGFSPGSQNLPNEARQRIRSDRKYLEFALKKAATLLKRGPFEITGDACRCPFHQDEHPSGSLHPSPQGNGKADVWLYTCHGCSWNSQNADEPKNTGDAIAVLLAAAKHAGQALSFNEARKQLLASSTGPHAGSSPTPATSAASSNKIGPAPEVIAAAETEADEAFHRLVGDEAKLQDLWKTRAIDINTVKSFKLGFLDDGGGRSWWCFPIQNGSQFMVQKRHAADGQQPKCRWHPAGAKHGHPLFPIELSNPGPVWLCPGELKALAAISLGLPAVGWTAGETTTALPDGLTTDLSGRSVAIVPDEDAPGKDWAQTVSQQLAAAGIDVRIVKLRLKPREDLGDWIVAQRVTQNLPVANVAARLQQVFTNSPPISKSPPTPGPAPSPKNNGSARTDSSSGFAIRSLGDIWVDPETWKPVERVATGIQALDDALAGGFCKGALHIVTGKAGNGKTQLVAQLALNAAIKRTPVGFISLEMDAAELARLALAQLAGVSRRSIDHGLKRLPDRPMATKVKEAMHTYSTLPLHIVDGSCIAGGVNRTTVCEIIAKGVAEHEWQFVILDHLGELAPASNDPCNDALQVDKQNASDLRAAARTHKVALVAVAPVRKEARFKSSAQAGSSKNVFQLDDLLGSATLGYSLDSCIAVRAEYKQPPGDSHLLLELLKVRHAPPPRDKPLPLLWRPFCGQVTDPGST